MWPGAGGRRVQICGRLESRLESRTAAQVFYPNLVFLFLDSIIFLKLGLQFDLSEKNLDYSGTNFDSFLLRIAPGFWDLVHQIAREKQYPGKKIQNISFSHFPDELSGARCLCWFSIVKPLWFLGASTGTHFDPLDNWFSTRGKKFPNAVGINPIGKKTFMSNHSAKAQKVQ